MKKIRLNKIVVISFLVVCGFILSSVEVSAQSLSISPASETVPVGGARNFNIIANSPGSNSGIAVRMNINSSIANFTAVTLNSGFTISTGCAGGNNFDADELCFDAAQGSAFTNGYTIATVTVAGVADGSLPLTFASGTEFSDGGGSTAFTGTAATYTVSSAIPPTLPDTGIVEDVLGSPLLISGGILLALGIMLKRDAAGSLLGFTQSEFGEGFTPGRGRIANSRFGQERDEFESKFSSPDNDQRLG